jgi:hypothetical protein
MSTTCDERWPSTCGTITLPGLLRSLGQLTPAQADTHPPEPVNLAEFRIRRKQVLGGLTHEYYIAA